MAVVLYLFNERLVCKFLDRGVEGRGPHLEFAVRQNFYLVHDQVSMLLAIRESKKYEEGRWAKAVASLGNHN